MLKLYKEIDGVLNYWETWDKNNSVAIIHWGVVGEKGQSKEIKSGLFSSFRKKVQEEVDMKIKDSFNEMSDKDIHKLIVEYKIEGIGKEIDINKRHKLEVKMNEVLGWTGLGHCDGGSMGSGTMEVCCLVVSFDVAKKVIEVELSNTEFSDYLRIFDENVN